MLSMEGEGKTTKVCIEKIMLVTLANHLTKILNHKIFFKFSTALEFLAGPRIPKRNDLSTVLHKYKTIGLSQYLWM